MEDSCSFKQGGENVHEFAYLQCENHTQYNAMQMQDLLEAAAPIPISHCSSMVKAIAKEIRYIDRQQVCSEQLLVLVPVPITVLCISVGPRPHGLETRVNIKISAHPCSPRTFNCFSWDLAKWQTQNKLHFSKPSVLNIFS